MRLKWSLTLFGVAAFAASTANPAHGFEGQSEEWMQVKKITEFTDAARLGSAVALSGNTAVVGAPGAGGGRGAVLVFERDGTTWNPLGNPLSASNGGAGDEFGFSVAISEDELILVVGAPGEDHFTPRITTSQGYQNCISGNPAPNCMGMDPDNNNSVNYGNLDGSNQQDFGAVYVFERASTHLPFAQTAYLKAFGVPRYLLSDPAAQMRFGHAVSISGGTVVVGTPYEDNNTTNSMGSAYLETGAAFVFDRVGGTWQKSLRLKAPNQQFGDQFGYSVAISGNTIAVGAPREDSFFNGAFAGSAMDQASNNSIPDTGAVYVFHRSGGAWSQQAYLKPFLNSACSQGFGGGALFGSAVAIQENRIVAGAPAANFVSYTNGCSLSSGAPDFKNGAAFIFDRVGSNWGATQPLWASNRGVNDSFGASVSISGDSLLVGAPYEKGLNDTRPYSGAAYSFLKSGDSWLGRGAIRSSDASSYAYFGQSVALDSETLLVGAPQTYSNRTGAAYLFGPLALDALTIEEDAHPLDPK